MTRRGRLSLLAVAFVLACLVGFALRDAGVWLEVQDPLEHARAIVVLGGGVPFRPMEAARLYNAGWAPEVWVTQGELTEDAVALMQLGIDKPADHTYSMQVLERLGVPPARIRVLREPALNTRAELDIISRAMSPSGGVVILVTSKYHARRVRMLARRTVHAGNGARGAEDHNGSADREAPPKLLVRYAASDPFEAARWWRTSGDAVAVVREWFGILNAWAGFPVSSNR